MKKQDTAAFSLIRCDTEKKNARTGGACNPCCALFSPDFWLWHREPPGSGQTTAGSGPPRVLRRWSGRAWRLDFPRRWLRAVLPLLCLVCAAVFSGRFLAGAVTVSSAACETLTKATGHILLPLAGAGADVALFVGILAALLGTLCAYAVRWSPTGCGLLLTVLAAALLALLRPDAAQVWMAVVPAVRGAAAGRRRGRPQRIRSAAFGI